MPDTHVNESIDQKKDLKGNSRRGGDAPPEIQQKIVDIIIEEARRLQFRTYAKLFQHGVAMTTVL